jgi:riboflavin biosynthesis pyrimidine reductase
MPNDMDTSTWRERFDRLVAEKTRAAVAATLPPYVTDVEAPADERPIGNDWTRRLFDGSFYLAPTPAGGRPACSLVFVQSADGNTGAADPGSLGGGATDKHVIYEGLSRVAADAVLAGAKTILRSRTIFSIWHPELVSLRLSLGLPRHPVQIVATTQGVALDSALLFNLPEIPVVLLTISTAVATMQRALDERPWVTPVVMSGVSEIARGFADLPALGVKRVSCIGGRTLAASLLRAGLIDEVYLTTAARPGGEPGTPLVLDGWSGRLVVRKHGTGPETGVVFEQMASADR